MVLANWLTAEMRRDALTHELVHVLQDRLFDLEPVPRRRPGAKRRGRRPPRARRGRGRRPRRRTLSLRREGRDFAALPDVADLQRAIRTSVSGPVSGGRPPTSGPCSRFPYAAGVGFIHAFRRRHPWAELSALYQDPPRSSAQILHPERYFDRREDPVPLPLAGPRRHPARRIPPGARGRAGRDRTRRRSSAGSSGESARVSGWRGDRHALWDLPAGGSALVTLTAWDTEELAVAFARDYTRVLTLKHGLAAPRTGGASPRVGHRHGGRRDRAPPPHRRLRRVGAGVRARRRPRGHLGQAGAILTAPRCRAFRRRASSEFRTPTSAVTTRSTTSSPSSRACAR